MKIAIRTLISIVIAISALYGCKKDDLSEDLLKPWKAPETQLKADVSVGAYYTLSYNDTNWLNIDALYLPELGKYNSADPAALEQHVNWALESGIDFWICSHNRFNDSIILNVFPSVTGMADMKVALDLSLSTQSNVMDFTDSADIRRVITDFKTMKQVFEMPNYLKIDGKPVVVLQSAYNYEPRPVSSDSTDTRAQGMSELRTMLKDSTGFDYYFIANYITFNNPDRYPEYIGAFDALTTNMFTDRKALSNSLNENIDLAWDHWNDVLDSRNVAFIPGIFPGRNDTLNTRTDVLPRSEAFFTDQCKLAKHYINDNARIIIINSFNNWNSGSQVEPSNTYGDSYLNILRQELKVQ